MPYLIIAKAAIGAVCLGAGVYNWIVAARVAMMEPNLDPGYDSDEDDISLSGDNEYSADYAE
jgi:hypothetical protein